MTTAGEGERGFEFVEHTADVGIRAWGATLDAAFAEAARGFFAHVVDLSRARASMTMPFEMEADGPDRLLFAFLDELLFVQQTEVLVFNAFDVTVRPPAEEGAAWTLTAVAHGEPWDPERHGHVHEIKAITYHGIRVHAGPPAEVFVVVDI